MGIMRRKTQQYSNELTERRITPALAGVLTDLELDQPTIVALDDIRRAALGHGVQASARDIASRLARNGWLMPLRTRGMYEFIPASRAGRFRSGDPFIELRATLRRRPNLTVQVAAESAAWLLGLSSREPGQHALAAPAGLEVPRALNGFRIVRFASVLPPITKDGLPVWSLETLLVAMAARPILYEDWPNVSDWLPRAASEVDMQEIIRALAKQPSAAGVRLAYMFARGAQPARAHAVLNEINRPRGPVYFGPDRDRGKYDAEYGVVDSALDQKSGLKP